MAHLPLCSLRGALRRVLVVRPCRASTAPRADGESRSAAATAAWCARSADTAAWSTSTAQRLTAWSRRCAAVAADVPAPLLNSRPGVATVLSGCRSWLRGASQPGSTQAGAYADAMRIPGREGEPEHLRRPQICSGAAADVLLRECLLSQPQQDAAAESYDVIIVDSSDPDGPASVLFTKARKLHHRPPFAVSRCSERPGLFRERPPSAAAGRHPVHAGRVRLAAPGPDQRCCRHAA